MKVIDAINRINDLKPNTYSAEQKVAWLSELDGKIKLEVIDTHHGGEDITFEGYTTEDTEAELLVPAPYDDLYIKWLEAQIDYANAEYGRYGNSMTMFNAKISEFVNRYNSTHAPKGTRIKYF